MNAAKDHCAIIHMRLEFASRVLTQNQEKINRLVCSDKFPIAREAGILKGQIFYAKWNNQGVARSIAWIR